MPADNSQLIARIAADLREGIQAEHWQAGDRLPSEHELSADYQTSRYTVRAALKGLEHDGLAIKQAGKGWLVADTAEARLDLVAVLVPDDHDVMVRSPLIQELQRLALRIDDLQALTIRGREKRYTAAAARRIIDETRAAALIIFDDACLPQEFTRVFAKHDRHLIQIGAAEPQPFDTCCCDNYWSSEQMVAMAYEQGHRHIAYIGRAEVCERLASFRQRFRGWAAAVAGRGMPIDHHLLPHDYVTNPVVIDALEAWLTRLKGSLSCLIVDAVQLSPVIMSLARCGYALGRNGLSLLGLGGSVSGLFEGGAPPFTTIQGVHEDWEPVAKAAAQRAAARLAGDDSPPQHVLIPFINKPGDSLFPEPPC